MDGKTQPEQEGKDALQELLTWATATGPEAARFCAVLGEYGMGKTTTLKMFTQGLLDRKAKGEDVPLPIYVDLRLQLGAPDDVPTLEELLTEVIRRNHRLGDRSPLKPDDLLRLVQAEGAVMIFDGLDEKIVHLPPAKATAYIHMLWGVLPPVERLQPVAPGKRPGRLILSCRSHYFRDVFTQNAMLTGQDREGIRREDFPALLLLPFSEEQIRGYLRDMLGDESRADAAFALVEKIHNLRDLAARPVLLSHIAEHLGELERAAMRGEVVNAARLYDTVVKRWLSRDDGKHQLDPLHKRLLMERLAGKLAAEGARELDADALEMWLDEFLLAEPAIAGAYANRERSVLKEDLRAATFVVRPESGENSGSFRFAHTSLQEFFLACHLHRALRENHPERWDLAPVSRETYDFLLQLLQIQSSPAAITTWEHLLGGSQPIAARHGFLLWMRALESGAPAPHPAKVCLDGVDLEDLRIQGTPGQPLDLRGASLQNSELSRTRWRDVLLTDANLSGAGIRQAEFVRVEARSARFDRADLCGTTWRQGSLVEANFTNAHTQGLSIFDAPGAPELHNQCIISAKMEVSQASCPEHISPIRGHYSCITSASWSPDGTRILSSANDNSLLVWDAAAGKIVFKLEGHKNVITSCAWSPKGTRILSGSKDQSLCIWDSTSGNLLRTILGNKGIVTSCAWSPDESQIISGSTDSLLRVWDSFSGELRLVLAGHESSVCSCEWSRDGFRILSSANDTSMCVWDSATGNLVLELRGHQDRVASCRWSPDGSRILSGSDDDTLRIWDSSTGIVLLELKGHRFPVTSCAWSHDGLRVLSSSEDGYLRIWDSRSGQNILSIAYGLMVTCCAWSPNSSRILSGSEDHTLRVMDSYSGRLLIEFNGHSNLITSCSWSPDGSRIALGSHKNALLVLEASSRVDKTLIMHHQSSVRTCSWSPDGTHLVSGSRDHKLRIWDSESGALVRELAGHKSWVSSCTWSPDGSRILSGSWDKTLRVWDPFSGVLIRAIEAQKNRISTCAWSPDSSKVLCDYANNSLCIFDASSGKILLTMAGHQQRVTSCAWSQDGAFILTGSADSSICIWDAKSGKLALALSGHRYAVTCCAWSPSGTYILSGSGDNTLRVWNPNSGILMHELCGHQASISACAWSLDGSRILSGSHDNTIRIWDAYTGILLKIYHIFPENEWAAVRGDQRKLLASSENAWRHLGWREVDEQGRFVRWLPLDARVGPPE